MSEGEDELETDLEPASGFEVFKDPALMRPLTSPIRMRIYTDAVRAPVSAKELSDLYGEPIARVSYHIRSLADAGLLRVVRRTRRRGAVETHYRGVATLDFDEKTFRLLPQEAQRAFYELPIRMIGEDAVDSVWTEPLEGHDLFFARAHFDVTAAGRRRLRAEMLEIYKRLAALEHELRAEAEESEEESRPMNVGMLHYAGPRSGGRNGPFVVIRDWEDPPPMFETIPG